MNGCRLLFEAASLFSLLALGGCDQTAGGKGAPPGNNSAWREKFNMPAAVRPDEFPFVAPRVRDAFLKLDSAARNLADTTWVEQAGETYPSISWNGGSKGYNETYVGKWSSAGESVSGLPTAQNMSLLVTLSHEPRITNGFQFLGARHRKDDWGTWLSYNLWEEKNGSGDGFVITFHHPQLHPQPPAKQDAQSFRFPPQFAAHRRDDKYQYSLKAVPGPTSSEDPPAAARVARFWSSADSFRELALEDLHRLEKNLRESVASGRPFAVQTLGGPKGADVPVGVTLDTIPEAISADLLEEGLAQIERHRQLVHDHHRALHTAAVATFPRLAEIVESARVQSRSDQTESEKRNP